MELQQSFVDRTKVSLRKIAIINKLSIHTSQLIDSLLEMQVTNGTLLQEEMMFWIKETAIEGNHVEWRATLIDNAKEGLQLGPESGRVGQQGITCIKIFLDAPLYALQTIALAIASVLTYWQQIA